MLAGPGAVTVVDNTTVSMRDLGTNFFCTEADVGKKSRAEASIDQLKSLNTLVNVTVHKGTLTESLVCY